VASERLALTASGQVRYTLKTPYQDGTTHIAIEPLDLMARLAALVPTPRMHLTRYHSVLAPHSQYRGAVTPAHRGRGAPKPSVSGAEAAKPSPPRHVALSWARRLKRVFGVQIEGCARCGGQLKIIASIEEPQLIAKILSHLERAAPTHVIRKALGIKRIVGQERQSLVSHRATLAASNPTNLDVEQNAKRSARQVPHLPPRAVVEAAMHRPASSTVRFFVRRARVTTRICGSPNWPWTMAPARKPANEYASAKCRRLGVLGIGKSCHIYPHLKYASNPMKIGLAT
jgi:Putative transposase